MTSQLVMGTERAQNLQAAIQGELARRGYSTESDPVMAEYITIMLINAKTPDQITSELVDLIGSEYDTSFTAWLFDEASRGGRQNSETAPGRPSPEPALGRERDREEPSMPEPQAIPIHPGEPRRPPAGPRHGAPLLQHALHAAIPVSGSAQKRTSSMRSPSPSSSNHPNKARRTGGDIPTGPRAMREDRGGNRSLLDRVGPAPQNDAVQTRIDSVTGDMGMNPMGMGMMPGMPIGDMNMGMMNPMAMQEMMATQMALMSQMAMSMGMIGPQGQFVLNPAMMQQAFPGGEPAGRGRGRVGGPGRGRGRGGHVGISHSNGGGDGPLAGALPSTSGVAAPQPVQPAATTPAPAYQPPARPASPTICKFGTKCTNPVCRYSHPSPVATLESGIVLSAEACEQGKDCKDKDCIKSHTSPAVLKAPAGGTVPTSAPSPASQIPCKFGNGCTRPNCAFQHPRDSSSGKPCRFGSACTRADCPFTHPPGRVLPGTFHRGLSTNTPIVAVPTPTFHSQLNGASPHKSMSFKPDPKAKEFVPKAAEASATGDPASQASGEDKTRSPVTVTT